MSHHQSHDSDHHGQLGHIVPRPIYLKVFLSLIVLTVITVGVAHINISPGWNILLALVVATVKAVLVLLFFMHLKYESKVTWAYFAFPVILVAILIGGVYSDNPFRVHTEPVKILKKN